MSTMQIEIHGYFPAGELKILLGVYNSSFPDNPTIYPKLIKMGDWEVGNEDDDNNEDLANIIRN